MKNCCCAFPAICGECVTQIICVFLESSRNFSATLLTVSPEIPVSISSKISTEILSTAENTVLRASIIREISPPEAILARGLNVSPTFVAIKNSALFMPCAVISSVFVISTLNFAFSIFKSLS